MRYLAGAKRLFGVSVPLGSIRTRNGWRVGEYPDLVTFGRLCASIGAGLIQILPVNDTGGQSSPYSALSAFALHPLYIRVHDLPEAAFAPAAIAALDAFAVDAEAGERFPYAACLDAKLAALWAVYDASCDAIARAPDLDAFVSSNPWVKTYSVFKRLKAQYGERPWRLWPENRDPSPREIEALWKDPGAAYDQRFHAWAQMRASDQFSAAADGLSRLGDPNIGVALLGDIPILMNEDSADVWADRSFFDTSMRAGAPPDMYSSNGQNWGFPLYDWDAMAEGGYSFWKARIAQADAYYSAYRIDHVLGFFRIWALGDREETGILGRFVPGPLVSRDELRAIGFSEGRIRWLSEPHIPGSALRAAIPSADDADGAVAAALEKIGNEDLFLFRGAIRGEADIGALGLDKRSSSFLKERWRDRALLASGADTYAPTWAYRDSGAWASLSAEERSALGALLSEKGAAAERAWEKRGKMLLSILKDSSAMLPCAEDLGAVPDCVPVALDELGIPGLRVPRWTRRWDELGQPFKPLSEYPVLSVCTPSVHDTSTLREWWEYEGGRAGFASAYCPSLSPVPERLDPDTSLLVLKALSKAPSTLFVAQVQDVIDTSDRHRSSDPRADRINVPGSVDDFNWTWRMGPSVEDLESDLPWIHRVKDINVR